jgi:hypothetical protein
MSTTENTPENTPARKMLRKLEPHERRTTNPSEKSVRDAFERRKKFFAENPGKHLSDVMPFIPKEDCDRYEAYFWKKFEEEKQNGTVSFP